MRHPFFDLPRPRLFGHRGASGELPENTLPAFARALEQGATLIETDVHRSADGHVVIHHDADLARTTDASGPIWERSLDDLRRLDAGHGFSPDAGRTHPHRGAGFQIPTLAEAFEQFPGIHFNVEIKENDPLLIEATLQLIREHDRAGKCLLAAGEDDTMAALRAALAKDGLETAMGASLGDIVGFIKAAGRGEPPPREPMALQIPTHFGPNPLVTPELLAYCHAHEVEVHVWTVNDESEMRRLLELGVDGVMSDFPARLRQVADAHGVSDPAGGTA
ncbi:MAG: glycerophosphodiester phosphodiesterase [Myxococcota bacterium]|nr:glycerophosphodiester phosphodiesterase [Myxococcota bacterium]